MGTAAPEIAAVAAATHRPAASLRASGDMSVAAADGTVWRVTPPGFAGLIEPGSPEVRVVAVDSMDGPRRPTWVAEVPGHGWMTIHEPGSLALFLGAYPGLPGETQARLVAVHLGPRGPERVLIGDAEIGSALEQLAPLVPAADRTFTFDRRADGAWTAGFLAIGLLRSPADDGWRVSVARWNAAFDGARSLTWERTELLSDAVLDRYRV
jgi:hypothetical protein